jgi:K+-sensing histidine kinase KdpD
MVKVEVFHFMKGGRGMLKSILVVIDGSESACHVQQYAINLAKKMKAHLTGIGVVDPDWFFEPFLGSFPVVHEPYTIEK